jgi:hypothetical protein
MKYLRRKRNATLVMSAHLQHVMLKGSGKHLRPERQKVQLKNLLPATMGSPRMKGGNLGIQRNSDSIIFKYYR